MTVKELRTFLAGIPANYDDSPVVIFDDNEGEYHSIREPRIETISHASSWATYTADALIIEDKY